MEEQCLRGSAAAPVHYTGPYKQLCILNENVFEHILSFLSNQALTKLQAATGDCYPKCEPYLAQYCCDCGNDNPKMLYNVCRECESKWEKYLPFVDTEAATSVYGFKIRELADCPRYPSSRRQDTTLYSRVDLEEYLIRMYGSKIGWVREIARRDKVDKMIEAMEQQERDEREIFMEALAPGFPIYAALIDLEETNQSLLWQCGQRFTALAAALNARGLQLRTGPKLCERFVAVGDEDISHVVDTMEEMGFLDSCTDYLRRSQRKIDNIQNDRPDDNSRCDLTDNERMQECREEAKKELCLAYLKNHRGLKLPRKWERCRARFEEVQWTGGTPQYKVDYIYND